MYRYRYLVKHGKIHFIEKSNDTLFIELPQIPNILIVYRRPNERLRNPERLQLSNKQFKMIPLLEGEEELKTLLLDKNNILKLENLISLPKLEVLDCSHNKISEINEIKSLIGLRTVCLGFNEISNIEPVKYLSRVRELDLQRNRVISIPASSLSCLFNLQRLNLSFNYLTEFSSELSSLESLKELNLSNNKIFEIQNDKCSKLWGLEILNLASNNFESVESLKGLSDLKILKNLNLLSTPLFVMKPKEQKEKIRSSIIDLIGTLKILNCEEIVEKDESSLVQQNTVSSLSGVVKATLQPQTAPKPLKPEISSKEKQK